MVLYYLLWNYRSRGDATAAGAEALHAVAPKSVEKNIVRISPENSTITAILGNANPVAMTCAAPEGTPPAALQ